MTSAASSRRCACTTSARVPRSTTTWSSRLPSTIVNARVGYKSSFKHLKDWRIWIDVFNVFNAATSDIDYYYVSRLPGEPPAGVNDIHTHPADSIQVRVNLKAVF